MIVVHRLAKIVSLFLALLSLGALAVASPLEGDSVIDRLNSGIDAFPAENAVAKPLAAPPNEAQTAALLRSDAPTRDLISLTQRLKLGGNGLIPAVVNTVAPDYAVGTRHQFFIADIEGKGYYPISATVRVVTPHAYWYVKDGHRVDLKRLEGSAKRFESHIYPTNRRVFGSEATPGIDNDPRITVLLAPIAGVGGYFSSADSFPRIVNRYSNERDIIYMSSTPDDPPGTRGNYFESTLAHEFQHMIQWNVNRDRDIWLDEGFSEIASHVNGYDVGGSDFAFTVQPDTQLNAWAESGDSVEHYGASYLFFRYLMDRYGGEKVLPLVLRQEGLGTGAIDSALRSSGQFMGFDGAFKDWTVANVLNDKTIANGRYSYSAGGRVSPSRTLRQYPATRSETVHQHGADYIALAGNLKRGTVTFRGNRSVRVLGADAWNGGAYWYSNRRDGGDATLTREVDLSRVTKATLRFQTWYDIEQAYDYTYVAASTDNGKSWTTLKGRNSTNDNPNGSNFGNGWTGRSGNAVNGKAAPRWIEEQIDLTPYTGKRVLVRFEYVTDEGLNKPGMAIDAINIPEIGWRDDAESDTGWTARGFIRVGNRVPQRWYVAVIEKGIPNRVREMVINANGEGTLDLTPLTTGRTQRNDILVIAPLAPKTTEVANYTVTVRPR